MIIYNQSTKKVHSDSESNSDSQQETENDILQNKLKQKEIKYKKIRYTEGAKLSLALIIIAIILSLVFLIHSLIKTIPQTSMTKAITNESDKLLSTTHNQPDIQQPRKAKSQQYITQKNQQKEYEMQLQDMSKIQLKNSFFLFDGADHKNKNVFWLVKREQSCVPNQKLKAHRTQSGYLVNTAYEDIHLFQKDFTAERNLYEFQSVRQLVKNISINFPNKIMKFNHYDTYLLVLLARYFQHGVYVTQAGNWIIMKKNLILNDLIPLVRKTNKYTLLQKDNEEQQLVLTEDKSLLADLLLEKKLTWILFHYYEPFSLQHSQSNGVNIYQVSQAKQCQKGSIGLVEKNSLRTEDKHIFLPGWYLFVPESIHLNFNRQFFNYQTPLINTKEPECQNFSSQTSYLVNNKIYSKKLPLKQHHFFSYDDRAILGYQQVNALLKKIQIFGGVYLQSGPCQLFLIVFSQLKSNQSIYVNQNYKEKKLLFKNLILNNQQRVKIINQKQVQKSSFSLVITDNHEILAKKYAETYLLVNNKLVKPFKDYNYSLVIRNQCKQPKFTKEQWNEIPQGLLLVQKKQKGV